MGNTLLDIYDPTLWAQETLMQLYPNLRMAGMVHRGFDNIVASQGDTVKTRLPNLFVAQDVNPASFSSQDPTAEGVEVKLDQWKHVTFGIGDKEQSLSIKDFRTEFAEPAAQAMVKPIEVALLALYKDVANYVGTAGSTPDDVAELGTNVKEAMDLALIPENGRNMILNSTAENKFHQVFYQAYVAGSAEEQTTGRLQRKFGIDYFGSTLMPKHTAGTIVGDTVTVDGAQDSGGTALTGTLKIAATTDKTVKKGDILNIATGDAAGKYVVTEDATVAASKATLKVAPALRGAAAGGETITFVATHAVNLGFVRDAFCLVTRPMNVPTAPGANVVVVSFGGIGLRSAVWYEPKDYKTYVRLDLLFGVKTLDQRKAIRLIG